jgi:predicted Zn-dependent protease
MRVDGVRICPNCGTRNKAAWEYCVRCSESIADVPLGVPAETVVEERAEPEPSAASSWVVPVVAVVAVAAAWAALSVRRPPEQADVVPGLTFATLPPSPAAYSPPPRDPGRDAFEEGRRLLARGQAAEAAGRFAAAVDASPENPAYREAWGQALLASGATDEGLGQLETAARLAPADATYPRALARALSRAGRPGEAMAAYQDAVSADPGHAETARELAELYMRSNRMGDAVPLLRTAAERRPGDLAIAQQLGHALERTGDREGAARIYEGILARAPEAHLTRGLLAEVHISQGRFDEGIGLFQEGIARDADAALLYRGLASALERAGRAGEAAAAYREYARLAPGAADAGELAARAAALERKATPAS